VFIAAAGSVLVFAVWALAAPASTETVVGEAKSFISTWFGWWYFILSTAIVGLVIFIGASKYGRYRLGPEESRPEYSLFTWTSMLFAAGIGIDLMFFSVAEPVYDYVKPPVGPAQTNDAAREAVTWTIFHYGVTGWAMYALMGGALAGTARIRLRLGLSHRATGERQLVHAPRPREGARWLFVAQQLHRVLGAARGPRLLGARSWMYGMRFGFDLSAVSEDRDQ
jgi:choline/glycine/proline betaine transport protein